MQPAGISKSTSAPEIPAGRSWQLVLSVMIAVPVRVLPQPVELKMASSLMEDWRGVMLAALAAAKRVAMVAMVNCILMVGWLGKLGGWKDWKLEIGNGRKGCEEVIDAELVDDGMLGGEDMSLYTFGETLNA